MKNIPILERCIKCPKCERKTLRKSLTSKSVFGSNVGREYFCDQCHLYFGVQELIDNWNYDAANFFETTHEQSFPKINDWGFYEDFPVVLLPSPYIETLNMDEPMWWTNLERQEAYEMVDRMFLGIPEMEQDKLDYGSPIGDVGSS